MFRIFSWVLLVLCGSFMMGASMADESPLYDDDRMKLFIPSANAGLRPGMFQNIEIEFFQDNLWRLVDVWEAVPVPDASIQSVTLVTITSVPIQQYLKVIGQISICSEIGRAVQRRTGTNIEVYLYQTESESSEPVLCGSESVSFEKIIPLDVYGLDAGEYGYSLNSRFGGMFTLSADNILSP